MKVWNYVFLLFLLVLVAVPIRTANAEDAGEERNDVYDALKRRIRENWKKGMDETEKEEKIEVKGDVFERTVRSLANVFYDHMASIKAGALLIGVLSVTTGTLMAAVSKLNKGLRRFAIGVLVVAVPIVLIVFVFGVSKFVSMFI